MRRCEHVTFPSGKPVGECSRKAVWLFKFEYANRLGKGETALCVQHYKMQLKEDPTGRVNGNIIDGSPWVKIEP